MHYAGLKNWFPSPAYGEMYLEHSYLNQFWPPLPSPSLAPNAQNIPTAIILRLSSQNLYWISFSAQEQPFGNAPKNAENINVYRKTYLEVTKVFQNLSTTDALIVIFFLYLFLPLRGTKGVHFGES